MVERVTVENPPFIKELLTVHDEAVKKVREALDKAEYNDIEIKITENTIFTVEDAAFALSVPANEILKSLVFLVDESPALVLMSGENKVNSRAVARALGGKKSKMARPEYVFDNFGFQVGGVPPIGYPVAMPALLDDDLFKYDVVWAAAGNDHAYFPIQPDRLLKITNGIRASIKKADSEENKG